MGGAVGDALGYPVEFIYSYEDIQRQYGVRGITRLDIKRTGHKAWISDDTQMTLFTACGLLNSRMIERAKFSICEAYIEWYHTQMGKHARGYEQCWIQALPEINQRRAPGNTCVSALQRISCGGEPNNNSKGCGGIMRTAPVALYGVSWIRTVEKDIYKRRIPDIKDVDMLAADAAEITHQHPLGWLPSALEAHIIYRLIENENPSVEDFEAYITEGYEALEEFYPEQKEYIDVLRQLIDKALGLVGSVHLLRMLRTSVLSEKAGQAMRPWLLQYTARPSTSMSLRRLLSPPSITRATVTPPERLRAIFLGL